LEDRDEILLEVARLIWRRKITIAEFYEVLGVDLDDVQHSNPSNVVTELAGIFKGWHNPPPQA
jgi:hypothetical protein